MRDRQRPSLADRFALRVSTGRQVDGLWVGVFLVNEPELVLHRVEEALRLIKEYDRLRYDRLICDLKRVWVRLLPGVLGNFNYALYACELDSQFVVAETSLPELIAATIVHEATHARLRRCGIGYEEALRPRVEAVCLRRELAFAAKLPNGKQVREQAERTLVLCSTQEYWTSAAFAERRDKDHIEALRNLGVPDWLVRTVLTLRTLRLRVSRFAESVTRLIQRR
jgi:hypothetical protein